MRLSPFEHPDQTSNFKDGDAVHLFVAALCGSRMLIKAAQHSMLISPLGRIPGHQVPQQHLSLPFSLSKYSMVLEILTTPTHSSR